MKKVIPNYGVDYFVTTSHDTLKFLIKMTYSYCENRILVINIRNGNTGRTVDVFP